MQQPSQTPPPMGPLNMPRAFRRPIGAHGILVSLLLADVGGVLFWPCIGGLIVLLLWWLVQILVPLLHARLLLGVSLVLVLACASFGLFWQFIGHKRAQEAWRAPGPVIILLTTALLLVALLRPAWMTIPSPIPAIAQPFLLDWSLRLMLIGDAAWAALALFAHIALWRRARREAEEELLPYSRAHPGSSLWKLLEQAYGIYRKGLSRFAHPPLRRLRTPPMFYFYPRTPQATADAEPCPERELYWIDGELVICQEHLGPAKEQAEILLPLVARLLYDYNSPALLIERLFHIAHLAQASRFRRVLWLPIRQALVCERRWRPMARDRVLDRDRCAWECGEGRRLRKLLSQQYDALRQARQLDNTVPTLAERLNYLDSLLRMEDSQVRELRAALPTTPSAPQPSNFKN